MPLSADEISSNRTAYANKLKQPTKNSDISLNPKPELRGHIWESNAVSI